MEAFYQYQEEFDLDALTSRLSNEFNRLALNLEAAAQGRLPICVDLYRILNQCSELDPLWRKLRDKVGRTGSVDWFLERKYSSVLAMINCGYCFRCLIRCLGRQPNSTWDIKLASIDRRNLRAHALRCEEDNWRESREKHAVEVYLGAIAFALNTEFPPTVDFALILTDHKAINEYCVLSLVQNMLAPLSAAEVLAGADGAFYVRGDVKSVWGVTTDYSCQSTFIRYGYGFSTRMQTWDSFSDSTGEPQEADERIKERRDRWDHLPNTPSDFSAFAGAAALDPYAVMPNNKGEGAPARFQVPSAATEIDVVNRQVSIIDHAKFASGPSGTFLAPERVIDVYGFTQIMPSTPMNAGAQGLLSYESRDRAAHVSMTSPEADSPWSERDGPPPPYVLSPGTYHLRLEAATRPSSTSR